MQNILVTGGAGFIGSNFVQFLLTNDLKVHVINLDALTYAGRLENLKNLPDQNRHTFIKGDICDLELVKELMQRHRIDTIVHFAAETHVDRSIVGPGQFIQTNVVGTYTLLEAARITWMDVGSVDSDNGVRFHHISTDEVYGSLKPQDPPFSEMTKYAPNSPYAASKAASDHLVRVYGHTYGLPYTITNCSNNYGPYQFPEKLIPLMISNALEGQPLPVYGDGKQVRDWLYVEDHCRAVLKVLQNGQPGETYHIGGGNQPTNLEVVKTLCGILDEILPESAFTPHKNLIQFVTDRPGHDRRYAMDITKIGRDLGWEPAHTLQDGLHKTVDWYINNQNWVHLIQQDQEYKSWLKRNYARR